MSYAQQHGHAAAITEWGGCNDGEPYNTNITSYAKAHSVALAYYDSSNLLTRPATAWQLTATGTNVASAYTAIAAAGPGAVTSVHSASGGTTLAPEAIASAFGANLATAAKQATVVAASHQLGRHQRHGHRRQRGLRARRSCSTSRRPR